ncbi:MAG: EthD domain-containing protein [Hyphomicrobiaceae bacterium]
MIAAISLIRRRPDLSLEAFRRHWLHPHGTMTAELPATRRYVQHHPIDVAGTNAYARQLGIDGIPELWFDDIEARQNAYTSPRIAECNVDSENFIGAVTRIVSEPRVVLAAPETDAVARVLLLATGAADPLWSQRTEDTVAALPPGVIGYTAHRLIEQAPAPNSRIAELVLPVAGFAEVAFADEAALLAATSRLVPSAYAATTAVFRVQDYRLV